MVLKGAWAVALPLALSWATPVGAGTIRGSVEVRIESPATQRRPAVAELGQPRVQRVLPDRTRSVVYLESAPGGAFEQPEPQRARMDQRGEAFIPYVLPVLVGTTVDFPNGDPIYHNVFSLSSARPFDLGRYASGRSKSVRFDKPGIVRVFCDIHSHMSAFILVFAHRFFAATDAEGRYAIENVPAGEYEIVAWTDGRIRARQVVAVPYGDASARADFVVE